jgi:hypothetical protein
MRRHRAAMTRTTPVSFPLNLLRTLAFVAQSEAVSADDLRRCQVRLPPDDWGDLERRHLDHLGGFVKPGRHLSWATVREKETVVLTAEQVIEILLHRAFPRGLQESAIFEEIRRQLADPEGPPAFAGEITVPVVKLGVRLSELRDTKVQDARRSALALLTDPSERHLLLEFGVDLDASSARLRESVAHCQIRVFEAVRGRPLPLTLMSRDIPGIWVRLVRDITRQPHRLFVASMWKRLETERRLGVPPGSLTTTNSGEAFQVKREVAAQLGPSDNVLH